MAAEKRKVCVVLFQLGGPDSLENVQPFLYNLFCDPDIFDFPLAWLARKPLAWWIARKRTPKVAAHYQEIGGRSPILQLTERQARALENALAPDVEARAVIAMRYWHPFTAEAVEKIRQEQFDAIVLLPLYPQYSKATTGSSLNEWGRRWGPADRPSQDVKQFYDHPYYIDAVVEKINVGLSHFVQPGEVHLVFSAHGLPVSFIEQGDPYQQQVKETVQLVRERGGWSNAHTLCYQSKVGKQKWLEPSLDDVIHRLAHEKHTKVLVIPIAFVSEHIETLHEINIETREEARHLGIQQFEMMPALNDSPKFVACLADLVRSALRAGPGARGAGK